MGNLSVIENRELVQPSKSFELLPKGRYSAFILSTELKDNSKGNGLVLHTVFKITEPGFEGREIRHYYNVTNVNVTAQEIGQGQLSATAKACGLDGIPADSSELHERALIISVTVKAGTGQNANGEPYGPSNNINGWFPIASTKPVAVVSKKAVDVDDVPDDF